MMMVIQSVHSFISKKKTLHEVRITLFFIATVIIYYDKSAPDGGDIIRRSRDLSFLHRRVKNTNTANQRSRTVHRCQRNISEKEKRNKRKDSALGPDPYHLVTICTNRPYCLAKETKISPGTLYRCISLPSKAESTNV